MSSVAARAAKPKTNRISTYKPILLFIQTSLLLLFNWGAQSQIVHHLHLCLYWHGQKPFISGYPQAGDCRRNRTDAPVTPSPAAYAVYYLAHDRRQSTLEDHNLAGLGQMLRCQPVEVYA
jgi:hypothetical protein